MNLYTASADGKVNNWILMETELIATIVTELVIDNEPIIGINQTQFARKRNLLSTGSFYIQYDQLGANYSNLQIPLHVLRFIQKK